MYVAVTLERAGVALHFVSGDFGDGEMGALMRYVAGLFGKMERQKIRRRTQKGRQARADSGKPNVGCRPPYGYVWKDDGRHPKTGDAAARLRDRPGDVPVVRRIFEAVATGQPLRGLALQLTAEGVRTPTRTSPIWRRATLSDIVVKPVYCGALTAFGVLMPEGIAPALVDRADVGGGAASAGDEPRAICPPQQEPRGDAAAGRVRDLRPLRQPAPRTEQPPPQGRLPVSL